MEKHRELSIEQPTGTGVSDEIDLTDVSAVKNRKFQEDQRRMAAQISKQYEDKYRGKNRASKVIGTILSSLGVGVLTTACPIHLLTPYGPETALIGLGLLAVGGYFIFRKPKAAGTNQALMIAMKYGNVLTVSRLALEMDISFAKAEKIIQELVKSGVAEIDLEGEGADHNLIYRIKGL